MINKSIKADGLMPSVFISVNNKFMQAVFNDEYFKRDLPELIVKEWDVKEFGSLDFYAKENEITCRQNDVIQSIHYFYKKEQLFKIIYSYNAIKDYLDGTIAGGVN